MSWKLLRPAKSRVKPPDSFLKAAGIIKNKAQRRSLERHVKQVRSEWR